MAKFVIECPACGKFAEAKTGFFARKKIDCACGYTIDVRTDKLTARECPHCGNEVVFDQSKGEKALCPVCHEPINTQSEKTKVAEFSCAQCGIRLRSNKAASTYICPVCDCVNDVAERLKSEEIKKDGLASPMFEQPTAPVTDGWNCACGTKNITSSFCPDCGAKRPISVSGWDCTCGTKNINSNFCPNCGAKRPSPSIGWNCTCGAQNITSSFCPDCGKKKEDN